MSALRDVPGRPTIDAPPERVLPLLDDFREWQQWSPWEGLDPDLQRTFTGPRRGVGSHYAWSGNKKAGEGHAWRSRTSTPGRVEVDLRFLKPFKATQRHRRFDLTPAGGGTDVDLAHDRRAQRDHGRSWASCTSTRRSARTSRRVCALKAARRAQAPTCVQSATPSRPRHAGMARRHRAVRATRPVHARRATRCTRAATRLGHERRHAPDIKPRSRDVTDGLEKAAARGMLRAVGMGDDDWAKPQIGVASSWNEITPCNLSLDRLAQGGQGRRARRGRLPARVRHHLGLRRHLDGPRGHALLAGVARGHRRLGRDGDDGRAARRLGAAGRLRQVAARAC